MNIVTRKTVTLLTSVLFVNVRSDDALILWSFGLGIGRYKDVGQEYYSVEVVCGDVVQRSRIASRFMFQTVSVRRCERYFDRCRFFRFAASRTFILRGLAISLIFDVSDTPDWLSSRLARIRCPILIFLLPNHGSIALSQTRGCTIKLGCEEHDAS